jgi:hypothetical protein
MSSKAGAIWPTPLARNHLFFVVKAHSIFQDAIFRKSNIFLFAAHKLFLYGINFSSTGKITTMSFVSTISVLAQKFAGTAARRPILFASDSHRARIEKNIDRTGDAFSDAAQLLERCLPRSFGI